MKNANNVPFTAPGAVYNGTNLTIEIYNASNPDRSLRFAYFQTSGLSGSMGMQFTNDLAK